MKVYEYIEYTLDEINFLLNKIKLIFYKDKEIEYEYNLEEILEVFEDHIGLVITEFEAYDDSIEDIGEDIIGKIITHVDVDSSNMSVYIELSELSGKYGGLVSLMPTVTGRFTERDDDGMMSNWAAKYKVTFLGGDSIEYMDTHHVGSVSYSK